MRIKIKFSGTNHNVPFDTQASVNSYIHACLGRNNAYHDRASNYSISSLQGGGLNGTNTGLSFDNDAFVIVSSIDPEFINKMLLGVMANRQFAYGFQLADVQQVHEELFDGWNHFTTITPFLLKRGYKQRGREDYWKLGDEGFVERVKEHLMNKLSKIDPTLDLSDFEVRIPDRPFNKVKRVMVKNVPNFANNCWVSIRSSKRVATLIYHLGLGQSTGCGFGTVCLNRNKEMYGYEPATVRNEKEAATV